MKIPRAAQSLAIQLGRFAMKMPEGVGLITHNDSPIHPIYDGAGRISKWVIYFRKYGKSKIQPPSTPVAGAPEGIIDLGEGWKILKIIVYETEIGNVRMVLERIEKRVAELVAPDSEESPEVAATPSSPKEAFDVTSTHCH